MQIGAAVRLDQSQMRYLNRPARSRAFSLIEVMIATAVFVVISIGTMSTVIFMREIAEYDKQRIAAISAARLYLEDQARRAPYPTLDPISDVALDNFNTPDVADDLNASITMRLYSLDSEGARVAELASAPATPEIIEVEVEVNWSRTGRLSSRRGSMVLSTYKYPDL